MNNMMVYTHKHFDLPFVGKCVGVDEEEDMYIIKMDSGAYIPFSKKEAFPYTKDGIKILTDSRAEYIASEVMKLSTEIIEYRKDKEQLRLKINELNLILEKVKVKGLEGDNLKSYNQQSKGLNRLIKKYKKIESALDKKEEYREQILKDVNWKKGVKAL